MKNNLEYFHKLEDKLNSFSEDFEKFYNQNNKAAGTRIRKGMQEIKKIAQDIRLDIQEKKNNT